MLSSSRHIPLRLTYEERSLLHLLISSLSVSDYSSKIDIYGLNRIQRIIAQIKNILQLLAGMLTSTNYALGQRLFTERNFADNAEFYTRIFEIGRRYKIMNPEKMREEYGKLLYVMQDSQIEQVREELGFDLVVEIQTVYGYLEERGGLSVLEDEELEKATREIREKGKERRQVGIEIREKEAAVKRIVARHTKEGISADDIERCLYSIGDHYAFLGWSKVCCDRTLDYLTMYFKEEGKELGIQAGREGARLTHSHAKHYQYCLQSLMLWSEIQGNMYELWMLAEADLLDGKNGYRLTDTGQGLNRLQACPRISRAMHAILSNVQQRVDGWVGSSVIHLGDINVPNAFMFIDKYTQIPRILNPLLTAIDQIPTLSNNVRICSIVDGFGGVDNILRMLLTDFYRHAFDGSGADNDFSAGSCIDGRLTSAWNWCSELEKKEYFPLFLLTGFVGFDGKF